MFLLDTNVCIQFLRGKNPLVRQRLKAQNPRDIYLCSVVVYELYCGVLKSPRAIQQRADLDQFAAVFRSLPFDDAAAEVCADIRNHLETLGTPIGAYDLQIAAVALLNDLTVVTHNTAEFNRVPGLLVEDWEIP